MYTKEYIDYEIYLSCGFPQNRRGTYKGFFPDLAECYGEGETLDEAIEEANEAAYNWISLELVKMTVSCLRFLMKMIWNWKMEILYEIFP